MRTKYCTERICGLQESIWDSNLNADILANVHTSIKPVLLYIQIQSPLTTPTYIIKLVEMIVCNLALLKCDQLFLPNSSCCWTVWVNI